MFELQREEVSRIPVSVPFEVILVIFYIFTNSMPSYTIFVLDYIGVIENLHTIVIQRIRLSKIDNIYLNFLTFYHVSNSKKEPLSMTVGVDVILEHKVIFIIGYFNGS